MPEPVRGGQRYLPGLDGLRALAVLAVVAYHLEVGWAQGGLLGVGVFFTLSGYLITDLLLGQWEATGRLQLADFWMGRARRLLPALFVLLTVVVAWVTLLDRPQLPAIRGAVAASVGYVSNWWLIAQHSSYFARFGQPSPLGHLWSLAVEEQFYLVWPWLLWLGLRWERGRRARARDYSRLAAATLLLAAASALAMVLLYHPGYDPTRVYDGTDTRAFALLIGATLAFVWPSRHLSGNVTAGGRWVLDGAGVAGLGVIALLVWHTSEYSAFLYRGGMVLLSAATALVVGAAASPASRIGGVLGCRPLRWVGVRSYGIYLWHFPIIALTAPVDGRESLARGTLQVAASVGAAALSWRFIEEPVRHGAVGRWWAQVTSGGWHPRAAGRQAWVVVTGAAVVATLAGAGLAGVVQPASTDLAEGGQSLPSPAAVVGRPAERVTASGPHNVTTSSRRKVTRGRRMVTRGAHKATRGPHKATRGPHKATRGPHRATRGPHKATRGAHKATRGPREVTTSARAGTACRAVVHIGDSTSDGLISPDYLPDPRQRLAAQYARMGVTTVYQEISGGRSIVETLGGQANAYTVAQRLVRDGYRGCWVLALGTNDTADVYVGSPVSRVTRIQQMMSVIGSQPVMWVNVKSLLASGPYAESDMVSWDSALMRVCARYPNMRVYDWAAAAEENWFIADGIHYTSAGYAARADLIARALAAAFPDGGRAARMPRAGLDGNQSSRVPSCLVH